MVPIVREAVVARLSATTCIETWDYADALALEEVKAHAIDTVLDHFTELLEADTLSKLDKNRQRMVIAAAEKRSPPLLWELAQQGQLAALIWLLDRDYAIDTPNIDDLGSTPLFVACEKGLTEVVRELISRGANVLHTVQSGASALYLSCELNCVQCAIELIKAGADVNQPKLNGTTPLFTASCNGHSGIISMLLAAGADPEKSKTDGSTPLLMAAYHGHAEALAVLLKAGASFGRPCGSFGTPLAVAERKRHTECIALLSSATEDLARKAALASSKGLG